MAHPPFISSSEVKRIAGLARIALTDEEEERFAKDLSSILAFVEELSRADARGAAPALSGGRDLDVAMRADDPRPGRVLEGLAEEILTAAPEKEDDRVRSPAVF